MKMQLFKVYSISHIWNMLARRMTVWLYRVVGFLSLAKNNPAWVNTTSFSIRVFWGGDPGAQVFEAGKDHDMGSCIAVALIL